MWVWCFAAFIKNESANVCTSHKHFCELLRWKTEKKRKSSFRFVLILYLVYSSRLSRETKPLTRLKAASENIAGTHFNTLCKPLIIKHIHNRTKRCLIELQKVVSKASKGHLLQVNQALIGVQKMLDCNSSTA